MGEIGRSGRQAPREFSIDPVGVKGIRQATGRSQARFATITDVQVGTRRHWEQGRLEPTGPGKALLRAISKDPKHVLQALAD